ncbi:hypothetical protein PAK_P30127 [Pseudomonas phage PAK_P3]|uniref:Uncharacterized protein n=2 Tax=Nankokuvirus PAKP3 TaxID=1925782 RepID=F2W6C0_9CAUD|nr:hypothetical protein PAK_P30127 [Pseudomonas phage PAK_P3]ADX32140.1 hypothetical protein P3_CHA0129 [Pseudomonas phage P3_CHA]ADX32325.1 hypothetical protein PAK_P30127 [Pseudomonas phage PAK_P3]
MMENRNGIVEAACPKCGGSGHADSGGVQPWGEPISIPCDCLTEQEEFLAWANEEYEVEEGYELNESNPAVMENKKGWMARAALPKRSKFRQHLDECADEVDTWPSYKREALKNPSPKCSTCHDQGEVFIGPGKVESHMLEEPEPIYAPCPDCAKPFPVQAEQAEAEQPEVVAFRGLREPLTTVAECERIVGALLRQKHAADTALAWATRHYKSFGKERDAALARVAELEKELAMARDAASKGDAARHAACGMEMEIQELKAKLAELEKQEPLLHINPLVVDELLGRAKRSPGGLTWSKERCGSWTLPLYAAPVAQAQHSMPEGYRLIRLEHFAAIKAQLNPEQVDAYRGRNVYDEDKVYANWNACRSALDGIKDVFQQIDWDAENELAELLAAAAPGKEVGHE